MNLSSDFVFVFVFSPRLVNSFRQKWSVVKAWGLSVELSQAVREDIDFLKVRIISLYHKTLISLRARPLPLRAHTLKSTLHHLPPNPR